ncbi:MAG: hypothetical protein LRY26_00125 [Bacilli bacterium]|nr:hypothetical protein [Bacilli bacterium]
MKNKIIYGLIVIATYFLLFSFVVIYREYKNNSEVKFLREKISEIYYEELDNFLLENPDVYIYIVELENQNAEFNSDVIELVEKNVLEEQIVLLILNKEEQKTFEKKYDLILEIPTVIFFENGNYIQTMGDLKLMSIEND